MCSEKKAIDVDSSMLKQLARMYEAGLSIKEISEQMQVSTRSAKRILELLGYAVAE
jgi:DNA-binding transcriptional regulator LsrR (DeoR family)